MGEVFCELLYIYHCFRDSIFDIVWLWGVVLFCCLLEVFLFGFLGFFFFFACLFLCLKAYQTCNTNTVFVE